MKNITKETYTNYIGLKMKCERIENKKSEERFITFDIESIINWTITALYDGIVKRAKVKAEQYYNKDGNEYCKIIATYTEYDPDYNAIKYKYTIENWRNEWGNYINPQKTFYKNKIDIKGGVKK